MIERRKTDENLLPSQDRKVDRMRTPDTGVSMMRDKKRHTKKIPAEAAYEYICPNGHVRTEREQLVGDKMPICTTCHMKTGEMNRLTFRRRINLPKLTAKGSQRRK